MESLTTILVEQLARPWALAFAVSAAVFGFSTLAGRLLAPEIREEITLWLWGEYSGTWADKFCKLFDTLFSEKHLSLRCFLLSATISTLSVAVVYSVMDHIFGVIDTEGRLGFAPGLCWTLFIGIFVNIVPDYLSLYETRWILGRLRKVSSTTGQMFLLGVDLLISTGIMYAAIYSFYWVFTGGKLSLIELVAFFSIYSIFFYSTFITSLWAWLFFISTSLMRLFYKTPLVRVLDTESNPVQLISLVASAILFVLLGLLFQLLLPFSNSSPSAFDDYLCDTFPADICTHVYRITKDPESKIQLRENACNAGIESECTDWKVSGVVAIPTVKTALEEACLAWTPIVCLRTLADHFWKTIYNYETSEVEHEVNAKLYGCRYGAGDAESCYRAAILILSNEELNRLEENTASLLANACDLGHPYGCLDTAFLNPSRLQDSGSAERLFDLYFKTCNLGIPNGCLGLAIHYELGLGVARNIERAKSIHEGTCRGFFEHRHYPGPDKAAEEWACMNLGALMLADPTNQASIREAIVLFEELCDQQSYVGCGMLAMLYYYGEGVAIDLDTAKAWEQAACLIRDGNPCQLQLQKWRFLLLRSEEQSSALLVPASRIGAMYHHPIKR